MRYPVLLLAILGLSVEARVIYDVLEVDYLFDNAPRGTRDDYIKSGEFNPKVCQPSNVAVDSVYNSANPRVFITIPKISASSGIPSGLNTLYTKGSKTYLKPYPSWEENEQGNCSALQMPMAIAFDPNSRYLWVVDDGLVGIWSGSPQVKCRPKLVVYDTRTRRRVLTYEFPEEVVSRSFSFLNDLVLDYVDPQKPDGVRYVYMSESVNYRIIVFDVVNRKSWYVQDPTMDMVNPNVVVNGKTYQMKVGINGIALSPSLNHVFYSALTDNILYSIPTYILRTPPSDGNVSAYIHTAGHLESNSDGMMFSSRGLYYGGMTQDALYRWETKYDIENEHKGEGRVQARTHTLVQQNWETMQWLDSIDIDTLGRVYFVTERAQKFHAGLIKWDGSEGNNFRIFQLPPSKERSYLYFGKDTPFF